MVIRNLFILFACAMVVGASGGCATTKSDIGSVSTGLAEEAFADNFSGWKQIVVPFKNLSRKEIYNDAPNDGLGLSGVHGWPFGALNTGGPLTYYIDNFELR